MRRLRVHGRRLAGFILAVALVDMWQVSDAGMATAATYDHSSTVSATVDEMFAFGVAGKNSGSCNGTPITGTGSSSDAVSLGRVDKTTRAVGGQELNISSNAAGGFSVYAKVDGPLRDEKGNEIATIGNTNASPGPFADPGSEAFGYTTDSALGGSTPNRFTADGAKWAGIGTTDEEVMHGDAGVGKTSCIAYQITISSTTVGGFYGNNVTYTAVPSF